MRLTHKEGFWEGYYCQLRELSKVLEQVGIKKETVEEIFDRYYIYSWTSDFRKGV